MENTVETEIINKKIGEEDALRFICPECEHPDCSALALFWEDPRQIYREILGVKADGTVEYGETYVDDGYSYVRCCGCGYVLEDEDGEVIGEGQDEKLVRWLKDHQPGKTTKNKE